MGSAQHTIDFHQANDVLSGEELKVQVNMNTKQGG